jgi:hypothetical protein
MAGRALERKKRRMPCEVRFEGQRHSGLVVDLSPSGLFIQTSAKAKPGAHLDVDLSVPGEAQKLRLDVAVVRQRLVPAQLRTVAQGGMGVRIINAPEAYYRFMSQLKIGQDEGGAGAAMPTDGGTGRRDATAASEVVEAESVIQRPAVEEIESPPTPRFRVRVSQTGGSRSRRLDLAAEDEAAARTRALTEVGEGWRVLDVEPL